MTLNIKKSYKDSLFRYLFQEPEELIALCNAVCGTEYPKDTQVEITTLEDVIYMGIKNDISFILDVTMHLYEHQSTLNPNIALRGVFYFAQLYRKYVEKYALNIYGRKKLTLPMPRYLVFCNDERMKEERIVYRLSESFGICSSPALECVAEVININCGCNEFIMNGCKKLREYGIFVEAVRVEQRKGALLEEAIDRAVDTCMEAGVLADFLTVHRAEVKDMILEEYDFDKHMEMERRDARAEGIEEGKAKGIEEGIAEGIEKGIEKGKAEGEQRINELIQKLLANSREAEIAKMAIDRAYQEKLFAEFGL